MPTLTAEIAVDPETKEQRPRPEAANKDIALMHLILEYGIRIGMLEVNPFDNVTKLRTKKTQRYVSDYELDLAVRAGRSLGGARHVIALGLKIAFLCVRRSVEMRNFTRDQIKEEGILWTAGKRQRGQPELHGRIEWSPELRATIDEALAVKRNRLAGDWHVFGNLAGQRYTRDTWSSALSRLMDVCVEMAEKEGKSFEPFSLQDCRPQAVSDKMERRDTDVVDAASHTSERMVREIYDRRRVRVARPAR